MRDGVRGGLLASLALVPSVFVYGTVFGGLAVQAGLRPVEVNMRHYLMAATLAPSFRTFPRPWVAVSGVAALALDPEAA